MWALWYGKRKNKYLNKGKDHTYMSRLRKSLVTFIFAIGNYTGCHHLPERSFFYRGKQFPVCARCTGVFIGQLFSCITGVFINMTLSIPVLFLAIMGIDWGLQEFKIKPSTNFRRLITGILGGFGLFSIYIIGIKNLISKFK